MNEFTVVGLGNPGSRYAFTRHNAGFMYVDEFLRKFPPYRVEKKERYVSYKVKVEGIFFTFFKPMTFMNLSGEIFDTMKPSSPPLVVHDDMDLPLGRIRIRKKGSHGGHKGVQSIIEHLGSEEFPRLRIGIGPKNMDAVSFVLSQFEEREMEVLKKVLSLSIKATITIAKEGLEAAMNEFNGVKVM